MFQDILISMINIIDELNIKLYTKNFETSHTNFPVYDFLCIKSSVRTIYKILYLSI